MAKIIGLCTSKEKGTRKVRVEEINLIENHGLEGDAHAGNWHRQVSLLSAEKIKDFNDKGGNVVDGDFGENIIVSGIDLSKLPIGTKLQSGNVLLEVTQIGKKCHQHCEIFHAVGDCIMPREGIFAIVLTGGKLRASDEITIL